MRDKRGGYRKRRTEACEDQPGQSTGMDAEVGTGQDSL